MGGATVGAASGRRVTGTGATVVVAVALLAACTSDDDGGSTPSGAADEVAGVELDTTTTEAGEPQPAATHLDEVYPYVEDLLSHYDELVQEIVADPSAVEATGALTDEFLGIFVPDSEFARASLDGWQQMAADDVTLEPSSEDHPLNFTYIDSGVRRITDDEVRFAQCTVQRYVRHEGDDETDRVDDPLLLPGTGTAVRVDGRWLLDGLETPPGISGCTNGSEGP